MEADLDSLLKTICPRAFPDVAPQGTSAPYIVWQGIGGRSIRTLDGSHCGERNTYMQISVWAKSRLDSLSMARQVEDALTASASFQVARPEAEPLSIHEPDTNLYGSVQRFSIWSERT